MPDADLVVKGRFLFADGLHTGTLFAHDGRVLRLERGDGAAPAGAVVKDFGDAWVLPGATDAHVHFRDPGHPEKEDFTSGSTAAAFGGVTAVLDMPNTDPTTTTPGAFREKRERAAERSVVDFGLYAGLAGEESLDLLGDATCMKVYMGATTGPLLTREDALIAKAVTRAAAADKTVAFHAEDQGCMDEHAIRVVDEDDWLAHPRARPNPCEGNAVLRVAMLPVPETARRHIAHLSTADGLAALLGTSLTCEVAPHHLWFTEDDLAARGGWLKMNPPLRHEEDVLAMWHALAHGEIDCVASDHAPHTREEKAEGVTTCPSGVPGVETMVPLLVAKVARGQIEPAVVARAACERPAEIFGLPKGRFAPGYDADFAVFDMDAVAPVAGARLHSRAGWSPFEGEPAVFPSEVWLRGKPVVEEGRPVGRPGGGRFLDGRFRPQE